MPLYRLMELKTDSLSLNTSQVPFLPIFADKLSSLGFNNFGLFLVTEKGTCKYAIILYGKFILTNETCTVYFSAVTD